MLVDPFVEFCTHFPSRLNLEGDRSRQVEAAWPTLSGLGPDVVLSARISRYTAEVFNCVLSGRGAHLLPDVLWFYCYGTDRSRSMVGSSASKRPISEIFDARAVAAVLSATDPPISVGRSVDLAAELTREASAWRDRAEDWARSRGQWPC